MTPCIMHSIRTFHKSFNRYAARHGERERERRQEGGGWAGEETVSTEMMNPRAMSIVFASSVRFSNFQENASNNLWRILITYILTRSFVTDRKTCCGNDNPNCVQRFRENHLSRKLSPERTQMQYQFNSENACRVDLAFSQSNHIQNWPMVFKSIKCLIQSTLLPFPLLASNFMALQYLG